MHHRHPAQPGGGDKAGEVGDRASPDGHDGVAAGEGVLAQLGPQPGRDLRGLGPFGVGYRRVAHDEAGVLQPSRHDRGVPLEAGGVHEQHLAYAVGHEVDDVAEHPTAHEHVVLVPDRDAHRLAHGDPPSSPRTSSATSSGVRPAVSTTCVATRS